MKRLILAFLDLRAQWALWLAEIHHDGALRAVHDAREEIDRALGMARATKAGLLLAQVDAKHAAMHVRRHRERLAMGLR